MVKGNNYIGFSESAEGEHLLQAFSPVKQDNLPGYFSAATKDEVEKAVAKAADAFALYKSVPAVERAVFLETIAAEIVALGDELIERAMLETGLTEVRLVGERARTAGQLKMFAEILREGSWAEAVIDTALPERKPLPRPDLRKMLFPLGPVVVFGASNFPFAFSTAGGDTASALAAGCTVIVKAHPAHLGTNELVAGAIINAAKKCGMPDGVFSSLAGEGAELGQTLAKHPLVKAIGFTGSYGAGMSLYKTACNDRSNPIPVYAEMSSINPVLILPEKLKENVEKAASMLAGSITLGTGQFCTNPGLIFLVESDATKTFIDHLVDLLKAVPEATMLNEGVCKNYYTELEKIAKEKGITTLVNGKDGRSAFKSTPSLLQVSSEDFVNNSNLQNEIFGPSSLLVRCGDKEQLLKCLHVLHGQLTGTVVSNENDIREFRDCIDALREKVGRLLFNGVPTGVEVGHAMMHGGPFPATTDSKFTSVGADAIKRFVRPVCFQDCPEDFLPDALKNANPSGIMRKVNGELTREAIVK